MTNIHLIIFIMRCYTYIQLLLFFHKLISISRFIK